MAARNRISMRLFLMIVALAGATVPATTMSEYRSFQQKAQRIQEGKVPSGGNVKFTSPEVNAWLEMEVSEAVPPGVRDLRARLLTGNTASGSAIVDFVKLRSAQGKPPNWLVGKLLQGEHEVSVTIRVKSGGGRATLTPVRVEISGVPVSGATLDFLVQNYLIPNVPDAKVGKPFSLKYDVERIDVSQGAAYVYIR